MFSYAIVFHIIMIALLVVFWCLNGCPLCFPSFLIGWAMTFVAFEIFRLALKHAEGTATNFIVGCVIGLLGTLGVITMLAYMRCDNI